LERKEPATRIPQSNHTVVTTRRERKTAGGARPGEKNRFINKRWKRGKRRNNTGVTTRSQHSLFGGEEGGEGNENMWMVNRTGRWRRGKVDRGNGFSSNGAKATKGKETGIV